MMKLIKVEIFDNREITGDKNALQFINRDATAMFINYGKNQGSIYLIQENIFKACVISFDTFGIDFQVISTHKIKA